MKTILFTFVLLSTVNAQDIVSNKSFELEVKAKTKINTVIVETTEACVFTYDPQWADDEDTSATRSILDNYMETVMVLDNLKKKGYRFQGYQNDEDCSVNKNTFPEVLTKEGSKYFVRYVKTSTLIKAIKEQNAFKKVKRVYVRGFDKLKKGLDKKFLEAKKDLIDQIKYIT